MAEILITGMDMIPKGFAYDVRIRGNGDVVDRVTGVVMGKAIGVPPHGDLIDRQKLLEHRFEVYDSNEEVCEDYIETYHVLEAPAIIEASN